MKSGQVAEFYNKFALSADRCAGLSGWVWRRAGVFCRAASLLVAANFGAEAAVDTNTWSPVSPVASVAEPSRRLALPPLSGGKPSIINGILVQKPAVGGAQVLAQTGGKETGGPGPVVPPVKREQPVTPPGQEAKPPAQAPPPPPAQPAQTPQAPAKKPEQASPAQPPQPAKTASPAPAGGGPFGAVQDWLARANREYQGVLMKQLSQPAGNTVPQDAIAKKLEELKPDDAKKADEDKKKAAEAKRLAEEDRKRAEALLKTEEARKAEAQKLEAQKLESQKLEAQKAEAQKEAQKKVEDAKRAEAAKKPEPAPPQPKPDDGKAAEVARQAEEAKKAETQKAREALQLKEAERVAEERRRQELTRIDEQKKQDAARQLEDRRKAEQAAAQAAAEAQRKVQEAEAAKHRSRAITSCPRPSRGQGPRRNPAKP